MHLEQATNLEDLSTYDRDSLVRYCVSVALRVRAGSKRTCKLSEVLKPLGTNGKAALICLHMKSPHGNPNNVYCNSLYLLAWLSDIQPELSPHLKKASNEARRRWIIEGTGESDAQMSYLGRALGPASE